MGYGVGTYFDPFRWREAFQRQMYLSTHQGETEMSYKQTLETRITRRTFVIGGVKEGLTTAESFQRDLNYVPPKAKLTMVSQRENGDYEFHFEYDESSS